MIKLSIVVPVYNVEPYIEECIESLINQSLKEIEIIIVNDGTKDNSIEVIKRFKDNRILIVEQENSGLSAARNTGLMHAKGEYVCFVDSDDFILSNKAYKEMYNIAKEYNCCMVVGNAEFYYNKLNKKVMNKSLELKNEDTLSSTNYLIESIKQNNIFVPVWLYIYKREFLISNALVFKQGIYHEDEEFSPRVILKSKIVGVYNKCFYAYRQRPNSIISSSNIEQKTNDIFNTCLELEILADGIRNLNLRKLFKNYISALAMQQILNFKLTNIESNIKRFIFRNSQVPLLKFKSILLLINPNILFLGGRMKRWIQKNKKVQI